MYYLIILIGIIFGIVTGVVVASFLTVIIIKGSNDMGDSRGTFKNFGDYITYSQFQNDLRDYK